MSRVTVSEPYTPHIYFSKLKDMGPNVNHRICERKLLHAQPSDIHLSGSHTVRVTFSLVLFMSLIVPYSLFKSPLVH